MQDHDASHLQTIKRLNAADHDRRLLEPYNLRPTVELISTTTGELIEQQCVFSASPENELQIEQLDAPIDTTTSFPSIGAKAKIRASFGKRFIFTAPSARCPKPFGEVRVHLLEEHEQVVPGKVIVHIFYTTPVPLGLAKQDHPKGAVRMEHTRLIVNSLFVAGPKATFKEMQRVFVALLHEQITANMTKHLLQSLKEYLKETGELREGYKQGMSLAVDNHSVFFPQTQFAYTQLPPAVLARMKSKSTATAKGEERLRLTLRYYRTIEPNVA